MSISPYAHQLEFARDLVLAHGYNSTCYQILNPGFSLWFSAERDAVVGYVEHGGMRIVGGAPVSAEERLPEVAAAFERDAERAGRKVCYFCAEARLERLYEADGGHAVFQVGAQPVWDPHAWPELVAGHASVRGQIHRAHNKGVLVEEWSPEQATDHPALRHCLRDWLHTRGLPPLHFLIEPDTLSRLDDRRCFVARRGEAVVGFLVMSPVPGRQGWLVEQFVRGAGAVNGTVELMLDTAFHAMIRAGSRYVTLGLAPLSTHAYRADRPNPLWLKVLLAWMRAHGRRFYNFRGLETFKEKFRPERWDPVYAIVNEPHVRPPALYAVAAAFAGGSPIAMIGQALGHALVEEVSRLRR